MCVPSVIVHEEKSTGLDSGERKQLVYKSKCEQCGVTLTDTTKVAAHVMAYPCGGCCCIGQETLVTTCKTCNNTKNAESTCGSWFCTSWFWGKTPDMGCYCWPLCFNRDARNK